MHKVRIFDTTLRDGFQPPEIQPLTPRQKLEIAKHLAELRVDVIEAGFPANENQRESVNLISNNITGPTICALARCVKSDIDIAWESINKNPNPRIHVFAATSDIHIEKKYNTNREAILSMIETGVKRAVQYCETEFSPEDATRSGFDFLCKAIKLAIQCGATIINIPDTVGYAIPSEFGSLIYRLKDKIPQLGNEVILSVHCHNDLNNAVSNSLTAVQYGANQIECTINGIGERAGNSSLEAVVMCIKIRGQYLNAFTEIKTVKLYPVSKLVSRLTGFPIQPNWPIVGANAFRHSSGIHGHGVIKDRNTYEIIDPKEVGIKESELVLGSTSGRHMVEDELAKMGYMLSSEEFNQVYERFQKLAVKKPTVTPDDLEAIVFDEILAKGPEVFKLDDLTYSYGEDDSNPQARVILSRNGDVFSYVSSGDGTIDAAVNAVNGAFMMKINVTDYNVHMVGKGSDAQADAMVRVEVDGQEFSGRGLDTDTVKSTVKAYLNALNRAQVTLQK